MKGIDSRIKERVLAAIISSMDQLDTDTLTEARAKRLAELKKKQETDDEETES